MLLSDLLNSLSKHKDEFDFTENGYIPSGETQISAIVDDSRKVIKGCCYVAIKGRYYDGYNFIDEAMKNGAKVIVSERPKKSLWGKQVTYIRARNSRRALSYLASAWYGNPSDKLKIIGITGTKGKTTSSYILFQLLSKSGYKVGAITSVGSYYLDTIKDIGLHVTNPEPLILQQLLSDMVSVGIEYVILEVTSHGLDQDRVAGIEFDYGVLTNIAPEHLDYHKTLKNYMNAKLKLLFNSDICILNKDDKSYTYFYEKLKNKKIITYSIKTPSDYKADSLSPFAENPDSIGDECEDFSASVVRRQRLCRRSEGFRSRRSEGRRYHERKLAGASYKNDSNVFLLHANNKHLKMTTKLPGSFNLYNILSAITVASEFGLSLKNILDILKNVSLPAGRLESIENNKGLNIFIDFAHTPDSLKNVLSYLKSIKKNKLIVVFGSAGERDWKKRPNMGRVAVKLADIVILTAEDPRSENVHDIIREIERGIKSKIKSNSKRKSESDSKSKIKSNSNSKRKMVLGRDYFKIPDRGEAIFYAINKISGKGDTVVICGKGQEKSMCYGKIEYPWSDNEAVKEALMGKVKVIDYENKEY